MFMLEVYFSSMYKLLLKLVIEGRMEGRRSKGRPRMGMMDDIMMGSYEHMKRIALDKGLGADDLLCGRELMMINTFTCSNKFASCRCLIV